MYVSFVHYSKKLQHLTLNFLRFKKCDFFVRCFTVFFENKLVIFFQQIELNAEKSRLVENLETYDAKMKALEQLRHCHDYHHDALQRQVLELTASSEDKVTIGIESSKI